MYKIRNPFLLFSAMTSLLFLAGCPNSNAPAVCDTNPQDPECIAFCDANPDDEACEFVANCLENPLDPSCSPDCINFPTLFPECKVCTSEPGESGLLCDCENDVLGDCCVRDPDDPACTGENENPFPHNGGAGDEGLPCATFDFCGNGQDNGFDDDCNGVADDGCSCSSATEDQLSCYTGPAGTRDVGTCADGTAFCEGVTLEGNETWGDCIGQTLPLPNDDCGDIDHPPVDTNCNGIVGDGCSNLVAVCPAEIFAAPLQTKTLTASATPSAGTINSTTWIISQRPVGSTTGPSPANSLTTNVFLDVAGDFTLTFTATDTAGASGSCSTIIHAVPDENLRIEVSWNTDSADIDSHLLHPNGTQWYDSLLDCDYLNCKNAGPNWPGAGTADNPRLDIDDVNGFGPENINIDVPEVNTTNGYRFGAYNFSDHGDGPSDITVRIFCGGIVKAQLTHNDLVGTSVDAPPNQLWKVADIKFQTTTTCTVTPVDQVITMDGSGAPR
jgi:hypothetical protein